MCPYIFLCTLKCQTKLFWMYADPRAETIIKSKDRKFWPVLLRVYTNAQISFRLQCTNFYIKCHFYPKIIAKKTCEMSGILNYLFTLHLFSSITHPRLKAIYVQAVSISSSSSFYFSLFPLCLWECSFHQLSCIFIHVQLFWNISNMCQDLHYNPVEKVRTQYFVKTVREMCRDNGEGVDSKS